MRIRSELLPPDIDAGEALRAASQSQPFVHLSGHGWFGTSWSVVAVAPSARVDVPCLPSAGELVLGDLPLSGVCHDTLDGPAPGWYGYLGYPDLRNVAFSGWFGFFPVIVVRNTQGAWLRWIDGYETLATCYREWLAASQTPEFFSPDSPFTADQSEAEYREAFEAIREYILAGDVYQVNYAQRFSCGYHGDPYTAWRRVNHDLNVPFGGFVSEGGRDVLCFSPEEFVHARDGYLRTRPIKGTRPRGRLAQEDQALLSELQASAKDRAENLMIVDLLRNDLGKLAVPGSVSVPALFETESHPHVHHMVSTVTAQVAPGTGVADILRACFPGGSVTGAPKRRACEIIHQLEKHPRLAYCGSMLAADVCGTLRSNLMIRTLTAEAGVMHCWGGGGLVADSSWHEEYRETLHKVGRLMAAINPLS